jgi:hypothetical protein
MEAADYFQIFIITYELSGAIIQRITTSITNHLRDINTEFYCISENHFYADLLAFWGKSSVRQNKIMLLGRPFRKVSVRIETAYATNSGY